MIKTNSERFLENRTNIPQVSALMAKNVSEYRRDKLAEEVEHGLFRDGSSSLEKKSNFHAIHTGIRKTAQTIQSSNFNNGTSNYRGSGDAVKQIPGIYSPLWLDSNLSLPRDRATINAWLRAYFALNPIVHNAISLHSTYPISKLNIKCKNKEIEKFFNDMIEEIDLMNICVQIAQEFWLLGEAFIYAELDSNKGKWSRLLIQNPDYMIVKRTVVANEPIIMLRPDENIKRIVNSNKPSDLEQKRLLNPQIINSVKRGENIPMDNYNVSYLARKISPYEVRGTGLPVCILRQLMLLDLIYESKFTQAFSMINPLTLVKVGSADFKPTPTDLELVREQLEQGAGDKNFQLITHDAVAIERIGYGSGIYDVTSDITQLIKLIYSGLQVPSVLMDGGSDTTYSNGSVALDVLRQRYLQFRNMMGTWLRTKIFAPISEIQGFYNYENGEKQLIIPEVDWNHMSLFDMGDYINILKELSTGDGDQKRISLQTMYRSLGLEYEDEIRKMRKEAIQSVIMKKEKMALEAMDLNGIRALGDDDEISESKEGSESIVPGQTNGSGSIPSTLNLGGMGNENASSSLPPPPPPNP